MGKFEKGHPGGPGRPRKSPEQIRFETQCREWSCLFALDKLKRAADSKKIGESIAAVKEILDRGFGKAEAVSYLEASVTAQTGSSVEELAGEIAATLTGTAPASVPIPGETQVDAGT